MQVGTLAFLARHRDSRVDALADLLVERIVEENPGYRTLGVVPLEDLWRSCHDNVDRVLELLTAARDADPATDPSFDAARATGARRAEQGLPLDLVLGSFRLGGRLIWDDLLELGGEELPPEEVREIGTRLWIVVDETSAQVAAAYHRHERYAVRADEQRRAELWEGLVNGRAKDPAYAHEAARILDLDVGGDLLVVVAEQLPEVVATTALADWTTSWALRARGTVGLVALRGRSARAAIEALGRITGTAVGVSAVVSGLGAVDSGFRQASLAQRTLAGRPGLAAFDARLPEVLLLSSPDVAGRLVATWLGPVLALRGPEQRSLLETLEAWVDHGGSVVRTASAVHCHRNTVVNRLRRVEELTGRPLLEGSPPLELHLALRALRARAD